MERIKRLQRRMTKNNPDISSLICFNNVMMQGKFNPKDITDGFNALVDKKDYPRKHYDELLVQAIKLSQGN